MSDHVDIQNLWSPSQQHSNDVSCVGLSAIFLISSGLKFWGLRWYNFKWVCKIMLIIKIFDLQVNNFPMMLHMLVYLKLFQSLHAWVFEVWDGIFSHEYVRLCWYSQSMISKSIAFQWCIICWFIWDFSNLYMLKSLRFEMVLFHMSMSDLVDIQSLWSPSQ